jgi:uncharacterized protein YprB with RNaseH-like and TPR domain
MAQLAPVAFDIETSGFGTGSQLTVAGIATEMQDYLIFNADGQFEEHKQSSLHDIISAKSPRRLQLNVRHSEKRLLEALSSLRDDVLDTDAHYLVAFNGETWQGGFDLPYLRTACLSHDVEWPFDGVAYVDLIDVMKRFNTDDLSDLVGVYETLVDGEPDEQVVEDPFEESSEAVTAFEREDWGPLLLHNLADIQRTRVLAEIASEYVPQSDFQMKNLGTPAP